MFTIFNNGLCNQLLQQLRRSNCSTLMLHILLHPRKVTAMSPTALRRSKRLTVTAISPNTNEPHSFKRRRISSPAYVQDRHETSLKSPATTSTAALKEDSIANEARKKKLSAEPAPSDFSRVNNNWKFGAHVSAAGGVENTIFRAAEIGANAFALFLKSQRKWESPPITKESVALFKSRLHAFGYEPSLVLPHGSYLINLGNPDRVKRQKSYDCFLDDLRRCELLGLPLYNFHPGSTVGETTKEESIFFVAECLNKAHQATKSVVTVIENMAGSGNIIGSTFAELADIIRQVRDKSRVGICLDTCHMFAAGFDIRSRDSYETTMAEFDAQIGFKYLRGIHLNDSKMPLASHKDRHENIGLGKIGLDAFSFIAQDSRLRNIPIILETPISSSSTSKKLEEHHEIWATELEMLNSISNANVAQRLESREIFLDKLASLTGKKPQLNTS